MIWRAGFSIIISLLLASCATQDPSSLAYGKRDVGIDEAFVLPANYSVVGITSERASNAMTQTIVLSTKAYNSGENYFRVTLMGPVNSEGAGEQTLSYTALTEGRISRELRSQMPGIAMSRSPFYVQNNYGAFSYATGTTTGGDQCIYAWQQIRAPAHTQNFFQNRGRIDLRLRLCETGASQEKLLATMYEFTINSTIAASSWNPYGEPAGPSPELGRPGNPLLAPAVQTNLNGLYPATDLNAARLNAAQNQQDMQAEQKPVIRRPKTQYQQAAQQSPAEMQPLYQPVAPVYNPASHYPQAPVVVPPPQAQPHATNSGVPSGGQAAAPIVQSPVSQPPQIQVPSPNMAPNIAGSATQPVAVPRAPSQPVSTIIVPSPCKTAPHQGSGNGQPSSNINAADAANVVCP